MAIHIQIPEEGKRKIDLDNGHVEALQKIVKDYNLAGEEEAVGFMLAVLKEANGEKIEIDGNSFLPSENIKKKDE